MGKIMVATKSQPRKREETEIIYVSLWWKASKTPEDNKQFFFLSNTKHIPSRILFFSSDDADENEELKNSLKKKLAG